MPQTLGKLKDYLMCALTLGTNPKTKWAIFWRQTKNFRVRVGLGAYDPDRIYSLDTIYGPLFFRDNFGDITNLTNLFFKQVYRLGTLPRTGAVIDVGANIGLAAAWFAFHNPDRAIYCFEPLGANADLIARNCPNARVEQVALGARRGSVTLRVDPNNVMASRIPCGWETNEGTFPVVPLDEIIQAHGVAQVAMLKMDAEGMELEILEGAKNTLEITQQVAMETHGSSRHAAVLPILRERGFTIDSQEFNESTGMVFASRQG
jgi:FkbM family methyltransferase